MAHSRWRGRLQRLWADNSLSIVCFSLFFVFLLGQSLTGWDAHNQDQLADGQGTIGYLTYLTTGHFFEAVFENWESEFLQMGAFVLLTAYLVQRGSAESKRPAADNDVDTDPRAVDATERTPWPARRGGVCSCSTSTRCSSRSRCCSWRRSSASEFLAVGAIVVLSVFLRERGSPESKPVAMPHHETPST